MMEKQCGSCKWFADDVEVCVNDKSEHCADFVSNDDCCAHWEEKAAE